MCVDTRVEVKHAAVGSNPTFELTSRFLTTTLGLLPSAAGARL